jgi:hypothetical protein
MMLEIRHSSNIEAYSYIVDEKLVKWGFILLYTYVMLWLYLPKK